MRNVFRLRDLSLLIVALATIGMLAAMLTPEIRWRSEKNGVGNTVSEKFSFPIGGKDIMIELSKLRNELSLHYSVETEIERAMDCDDQLCVFIRANGRLRRAFSIAPRPEGIFILGFGGCFRLTGDAALIPTIVDLVRITHENGWPTFFESCMTALPVEAYSYQQWRKDGQSKRDAQWKEGGWEELSDDDSDKLWQSFSSRFHFRLSDSIADGPSIETPSPFMVRSVQRARRLYDSDRIEFRILDNASKAAFIQSLVDIGAPADPMYAFEVNHSMYRFSPQRVSLDLTQGWPVSLLPCFDYSVFLNEQLSFGLFANSCHETICDFGRDLVDRLANKPLPCFES